MTNIYSKIDLLFETSWEVCNKIGGIYTVLSTKAATMHKALGEKLVFIGPDVWTAEHPSPDFVEDAGVLPGWPSASDPLPCGVKVRKGRWNTGTSTPQAVLVSFDSMYPYMNDVYGRMWQLYGVDSLHAYGDYDEACAFAVASALVIESIIRHHGQCTEALAHFDEWTTGMGLLHVKAEMPAVATVFTTHATSIGRSICGNGKPLYDYLTGYNGDQMSCELNMQSKHSLEQAAAHAADVFTTVSEVTARECEQLLGRRPDVVTPNGFDPSMVAAPRSLAWIRRSARKRACQVATALTGSAFDSDNTFIVATSGRCEYHNKGIDMMLDVLDHLRRAALPQGKRVLALVLVPAWEAGARADLQQAIANGAMAGVTDPIVTHNLHNPYEDAITGRIRSLGFGADRDSQVTVIDVPCYLRGNDGIFDMTYYDLLAGVDLTVFPSYYEPWGYTPLESVAFGVPTVTTSLSGFGRWAQSTGRDSFAAGGVEVVERTDNNYSHATDEIAGIVARLMAASDSRRRSIVKAAKATAAMADWALFFECYDRAYALAIERAMQRMPQMCTAEN